MVDLQELSAQEIAEKVKEREVSALEVTQFFLERIKKQNPKIHAFLTLEEERAVQTAKNLDAKISQGEKGGELAGVPIAIKDNLCVAQTKTTCASKILENFVSPYDATVIKKLRSADAIFIGKTNLDEFAMGSSTENSAFSPTKNPWNLEVVPGGSSGGSAAAVSSRMVPLALGSDTGGSIRQPASFCGVLGLKPTYGRVSRFGLVAFASSLDQIGPFARSAEDCALLLKIISGWDPLDSTSAETPVPDFSAEMKKPLEGIKIGIPKEYFVSPVRSPMPKASADASGRLTSNGVSGLSPVVRKSVMDAVKVLEGLGAESLEISLPHTDYATAVYYILAPSEASANLARYDGVRYGVRTNSANSLLEMYEKSRGEGFGPEVKRRIMLGTYALSSGYYDAYYLKAQKARSLIRQDFEKAFEKTDVLITPTSPTPPFKFGEKVADPLTMYLSDIFTISCNLAGIPGISIPCGFSDDDLPIGFQVLGKPFDESTLLSLAYHYQSATDWHRRSPKNGSEP